MNPRLVLNYLLAFFVLLSVVIYYLGANGRVNNFPTYLLGLLVLYAVFAHRDVRELFVASRILQLSGLLLCYLALSSFWSADFTWLGAGKAFGNVLLLLAFVVGIVVCVKSINGFHSLFILLLALAAGVSAVYSIYLDLALGFRPFHADRMWALGRLSKPVDGALAYGVAAIFTLHCLLWADERLKQAGCLLLLGTLLYAIYLTGSVAVWAGLLLAGVVSISLAIKLDLKQVVLSFVAVVVVGVVVLFGTFSIVPELWSQLFPRTTSYRLEIWGEVLNLVVEQHLLFGFGQLESGDLVVADMAFKHAHSIYMASFYYGGLIGLGLLVGLIVRCFWVVGGAVFFGRRSEDLEPVADYGVGSYHNVGLEKRNPTYRIYSLAVLGLTSLAYGCAVFALDGDRVLEKVDLIWIVFWLPVSLCVSSENVSHQVSEDFR